jgi:O-methyltransferase
VEQPRRQLAYRLVPRRVRTLDLINAGADFNNFFADRCAQSPRFRDREQMDAFLAAELARHSPIDHLQFGVWQGASLRAWARLLPDRENRFVGFDSFLGLPEDWLADMPDSRISIVDGSVQEVLEPFLHSYDRAGRQLTVRIDCDRYSSALFVLASIDRLWRPGDLLLMDEFSNLLDDFRAFADYVHAFKRDFSVIALVGRGEKIAMRLGGRSPE